jgi:hypothetical protein
MRFCVRSAAAAVVALTSTLLAHTGIWTNVHPPVSPPFRAGQGLAFDTGAAS